MNNTHLKTALTLLNQEIPNASQWDAHQLRLMVSDLNKMLSNNDDRNTILHVVILGGDKFSSDRL